MQTELIFSGFGGQGVLFGGMVLAYAGMDNGKNVTWIPSYGPEMRGGTAHVTVVISDEEIGSPLTRQPQVAVVFNIPSMTKYEDMIKPDGLLIYNSSLIEHTPTRTDIRYLAVPANDIAAELGNARMANMVVLGALVAATNLLPVDAVAQALHDHLPAAKQKFVKSNIVALQRGAELATNLQTA